MVDEFSAFARMPPPVMRTEDIVALCREALFLQQSAHPKLTYNVSMPRESLTLNCDATQISRALTNLLQNAAEAIGGRIADGASEPPGEIWLSVRELGGRVVVIVEDNGRGLPKSERHRLTEPYVTTRSKGTGLGLAIVKKIMEDHGGNLILDDRPGGGATVKLIFADESAIAAGTTNMFLRTRYSKGHGA